MYLTGSSAVARSSFTFTVTGHAISKPGFMPRSDSAYTSGR